MCEKKVWNAAAVPCVSERRGPVWPDCLCSRTDSWVGKCPACLLTRHVHCAPTETFLLSRMWNLRVGGQVATLVSSFSEEQLVSSVRLFTWLRRLPWPVFVQIFPPFLNFAWHSLALVLGWVVPPQQYWLVASLNVGAFVKCNNKEMYALGLCSRARPGDEGCNPWHLGCWSIISWRSVWVTYWAYLRILKE